MRKSSMCRILIYIYRHLQNLYKGVEKVHIYNMVRRYYDNRRKHKRKILLLYNECMKTVLELSCPGAPPYTGDHIDLKSSVC